MAEIATTRNETFINNQSDLGTNRTSWGAIWAGTFAFIAIWSVFGMLGEAIFASSTSPNAAEPVAGMSAGMGVWATILTIIAMYVGGRVTGHFSNAADRNGRIMHGITMFGLSVISFVIVAILGGVALTGGSAVPGSAHSPYILTVFADLGWIGFFSLFLGWLAAMGGAAHGALPASESAVSNVREVRDIRRAA